MNAKPCPFCGHQPDIEDGDTLYPSGTGWKDDGNVRTYHRFREVPPEQWCYRMGCSECDAEVTGDDAEEALANWNRRA